MKKLLFLSVVLFVLCGCSNDEMLKPDQPDDENTLFVPHFTGRLCWKILLREHVVWRIH